MADKNSGINQFGGSIHADLIAVGSQARAIKTVNASVDQLRDRGEKELASAIENLLNTINKHGTQLPDSTSVLALTEKISESVVHREPDRVNLKSWINLIVEETKSIAQIGNAAISLKDLIIKIFF